MGDIWWAAWIGAEVGIIGTGLGGVLAILLRARSEALTFALLRAASGVMLAVVCFDLLPEAFASGGMVQGLVGLGLGVLIVEVMRLLLKRFSTSTGMRRVGILVGLSIAVHNLPEGLAIGAGLQNGAAYGLALALLIGMHDLPEGFAMGAALRLGNTTALKVIAATLLAGLPTAAGALIGAYAASGSDFALTLCLGCAGGAMLDVTCTDLIPETGTGQTSPALNAWMLALGFVLGIVIIFILA